VSIDDVAQELSGLLGAVVTVAHDHPAVDGQQFLANGDVRGPPVDAKCLRGTPEQCRVSDRVGRRQQHQLLSGLG